MNGIRLFAFALLLTVCHAEFVPVVRGRVESDSPGLGNELMVAVTDHERGRTQSRIQVSVAHDGTFELRDLPGGMYDLHVTTLRGDVLYEETVDIHSFTTQLTVRLPSPRSEKPGTGTVSFNELLHPIPPKALRAFTDAQQEVEAGRDPEAIRKLERALRIYPAYAQARNNLGAVYIRQRRFPEALEQFQKALECGDATAPLYGNLAYTFCALGRWKDAEGAARHSVALDDSYIKGHYLLGNILARSVTSRSLQNAPEAARQLRLGAAEVRAAYFDIANIYLYENDRLSAAEEVRLYLKSGDEKYRKQAEGWLARILEKN
jgi:tetratricopeptide (TPR) repeat protein